MRAGGGDCRACAPDARPRALPIHGRGREAAGGALLQQGKLRAKDSIGIRALPWPSRFVIVADVQYDLFSTSSLTGAWKKYKMQIPKSGLAQAVISAVHLREPLKIASMSLRGA
jgi:hypothetical protein